MNRLSWDTTALRRVTGKRTAADRPADLGLVEEGAALIRVAWDKPQRVNGF